MKFFEAVKSVFTKYATFTGRARRSEYWYFVLFNFLVSALLGAFGTEKGSMGYTLSGVYSLAACLPGLAVTWRRLHDIGKSGKTAIFPYVFFFGSLVFTLFGVMASSSSATAVGGIAVLVSLGFFIRLLVLLTKDGQPGANEYGPDPKGASGAANYTAPTGGASAYSANPEREDKPYVFQRDAQPEDEIQAVVSARRNDSGKVSLWGEDEEPKTPVAPSIDYNKEQGIQQKTCPNCGAPIADSQKFCTDCGAKL